MSTYSLYFILLLLLLSGCKEKELSRKELIARKWGIADMMMGIEKDLDEHNKQHIREKKSVALKSSSFVFKEDGTFSINIKGVPNTGKWQLSEEDSTKIITTDLSGTESIFKIHQLTKDTLIVSTGTGMHQVSFLLTNPTNNEQK